MFCRKAMLPFGSHQTPLYRGQGKRSSGRTVKDLNRCHSGHHVSPHPDSRYEQDLCKERSAHCTRYAPKETEVRAPPSPGKQCYQRGYAQASAPTQVRGALSSFESWPSARQARDCSRGGEALSLSIEPWGVCQKQTPPFARSDQ